MKKLHWGHGMAIALGCFIIFILSMILFFPLGKQNAELISNNYYEEELQYQQVIDAKNNADNLPEKPIYKQDQSGIIIIFPKEIFIDDNKISFVLFRTEDSNLDIHKELDLQHRSFMIPSKVLAKGSYTLKVRWTGNKKEYQRDYDVVWK